MNNYQPANYMNPSFYGQPNINPVQPRINNPVYYGINWAMGPEGAKSTFVPAGQMAIILDSENEGVMYIKVVDNVGIGTLRTFHYNEVIDTPKTEQTIDMSQYITRDEVMSIVQELKGNRNDHRNKGGNNGNQSIQSTNE